MSIFSTQVGKSAPRATVASNGYRFTTTRSMPAILWSRIAFMWPAWVRRARMPPWIEGCRVFTRPSMISGKPVWSLTSTTLRPASRNALAEPPVDRISIPRAASALPNSTRPSLSETEIKARSTRARSGVGEGAWLGAADMAGSIARAAVRCKTPVSRLLSCFLEFGEGHGCQHQKRGGRAQIAPGLPAARQEHDGDGDRAGGRQAQGNRRQEGSRAAAEGGRRHRAALQFTATSDRHERGGDPGLQ